MADRTANLIVRLTDRVSGPARAAAKGLNRIKTAMKGVNGLSGGARLDAAIAKNNKRISQMRSRMLEAAAAAYILKRAIGAPIKAATEFESAMADVKKVVSAFEDITVFKQFQDDIKALSREIPRSIKELSEIAAAAGQAGLPHDEIVEFTKQVAMIATAFELSAEETGKTLSRLKSALKLTVPAVVLLADHMNTLANNMATSEGEVLEIVRRVGALADKAGLATKNVAALGAAMNSSGVDAEVAGTAIRNMLLNTVGNVTKNAAKAMRRIGIDPQKFKKEVADKGVFAYRDMFARISKLKQEDQAGVLQSIFGKRAVDALGPLMNNLANLDKALKLVESDSKNAGAAQREFATRADTFGSRVQTLNNRISELSISVGEALIPALTKIVETIGPIITQVAEWSAQHPQLVAGIIGVTTSLMALGIAGIGFGYASAVIKGGMLGLIKGVTNLLPFLGKMRTALMFTGVGAVLAVIAAAGTKIYNNWEGITEFFAGFSEALSEAFGPIEPMIQPAIDIFGQIKTAISDLLGPINATKEEWRAWGKSAGESVRDVINTIGSLPEKISFLFTAAVNIMKAMATEFYNAGVAIGTALWDGLKSIFNSIVAWVQEKANAILAPIQGIANKIRGAFAAAGAGPSPGGQFSPTPSGKRARGGPVSRGGSYIVGEERPEIFNPTRSGSISPSVGSGQANIDFRPSFHFSGVGSGDATAIAAEVRKVMRDEVREAFRGVFADTGIRFA